MNIEEVLTRGVEQILPDKKRLASLMAKKKITLYQGFDPSMPSLHLGNLVGLIKLRQFQRLGHKVIFLVGDFTGMIGDPDKLSTRKPLTREQTLKNAKNWKEQASKVLNFGGKNPAKILFNSRWNDKINFKELIEITSHFTIQQILERDMFQKRLQENLPIRIHEILYPVAQAIDSVKMVSGGVDLEIGGSDQLFNMLAGRNLMKAVWGKEKFILTTKLLVDKEGNKVGKTTGNALFLDTPANEFFAGIMAFPDEIIALGFELLTEIDLEGIEEKIRLDPMLQKKILAFEITKMVHGEKKAHDAQNYFEKTFEKHELPKEAEEIKITRDTNILEVFTKYNMSKSEAKRLLSQGAIDIFPNKEGKLDKSLMLKGGETIRIGKKKFIKIIRE